MSDMRELQATADAENVLLIDLSTRTIVIPESVTSLGVESDEDVMRLPFKMPRIYCGIDLSEFGFRINYVNANGSGDVYLVEDMLADDDYITFSWLVGRMAAIVKGPVTFNVCLKKTDSYGWVINEFNTKPTELPIWQGLETSQAVVQQNPEVLEAILLHMSTVDSDLADTKKQLENVDMQIEDALQEAKDSGEFDGPAGPKGPAGYTPVCGVDYFTDDDIASIVTAVISKLPVYDGEVVEE